MIVVQCLSATFRMSAAGLDFPPIMAFQYAKNLPMAGFVTDSGIICGLDFPDIHHLTSRSTLLERAQKLCLLFHGEVAPVPVMRFCGRIGFIITGCDMNALDSIACFVSFLSKRYFHIPSDCGILTG